MGMSSDELGLMTPKRFMNKYKGWQAEKREHLTILRLCTYRIMSVQGKEVKSTFSPKHVFHIPGDDAHYSYPTKEETEQLLEKWGRVLPGYEPMSVEDMKRYAIRKTSELFNGG